MEAPAREMPASSDANKATDLARLRLMARGLEQVGEGVAIFDVRHVLVYANPELATSRGTRPEELVGKHMREFMDFPPGVTDEMMIDEIGAQGVMRLEVPGGGGLPDVQVSASLLDDDDGVRIGHIVCVQDISERKRLEARLRRAALHDPLTDLPNRRLFLDSLELALDTQQASGLHVGVLFVDLDGFKAVNDAHGHDAGDRLLLQVAGRMHNCVRGTDMVARIGGDEFVVLLREVADSFRPTATAERIMAAIAIPFDLGEVTVTISASIGVATSPPDGPKTLLHTADSAMYEAKAVGPGRIVTNAA
jgi:diguanylate cyclase (GGDEF)-like protein/PAS domain S-box-containing protein